MTCPHGAPLRVRNERQLGCKMAQYAMRIEPAATAHFGREPEVSLSRIRTLNSAFRSRKF